MRGLIACIVSVQSTPILFDEQGKRLLSETSELDYLTHIVFRYAPFRFLGDETIFLASAAIVCVKRTPRKRGTQTIRTQLSGIA